MAALAQRLDAVEKDVASLKTVSTPSDQSAATATLSQSLSDLKAKIAAGAPYHDELDRISRMVPAAAGLDTLSSHANEGLPTAAGLAAELTSLIPLLPKQEIELPSSENSYLDSFWNAMKSVITIRRIGETDWPDLAAKCAALAESGDLAQAIEKIDKAEGAKPSALTGWRDRAAARIALEAALEETSQAVSAPDHQHGCHPMIKLLWRFGLLVLAALFFTWLADRPGTVTIQWMGREIQMAFVIAVAIAFLVLALLWFIWGFFRKIWRSPTAARDYWRFRKNRKAYESLSRGIIAAGAGDSIAASKHAAIAGNALADEPLVNVLAAQAAQLKGDRASVKRIFEEMTKSSDTEALGLRGLFAEARQNGDVSTAMSHAERALKLNPRLGLGLFRRVATAIPAQGLVGCCRHIAATGKVRPDARRKKAIRSKPSCWRPRRSPLKIRIVRRLSPLRSRPTSLMAVLCQQPSLPRAFTPARIRRAKQPKSFVKPGPHAPSGFGRSSGPRQTRRWTGAPL